VQAFIDERILFSDVPLVIRSVMDDHHTADVKDLTAVLDADRGARASARAAISELSSEARVNVA